MCELDPVTFKWTRTVMRVDNANVLDNGCGGHSPHDDYSLMLSDDGALPVGNSWRWWIVEGGVMLTIILIGDAAQRLRAMRPTGDPLRWRPSDAALEWVPQWQAFAFYCEDGTIYRISRTDGLTFYVEAWRSGVFPARGEISGDVGGGVLTKMACIHSGDDHFLAYHPADNHPIFCTRVA